MRFFSTAEISVGSLQRIRNQPEQTGMRVVRVVRRHRANYQGMEFLWEYTAVEESQQEYDLGGES